MQWQQPTIVQKPWGHEEIICNSELYCGKKLVIRTGLSTSTHYHKEKDEHIHVQSGQLRVELYPDIQVLSKYELWILDPGDTIHLAPGQIHRLTALQECILYEFSTQHREEDTVRLQDAYDRV